MGITSASVRSRSCGVADAVRLGVGGEVIEIQHKQSDQIRHGNGVAWAMPTSFIHLRIDCHTSYRSAQPPSGTSKHQFHSNADVGSSGGKTTAAGDGE